MWTLRSALKYFREVQVWKQKEECGFFSVTSSQLLGQVVLSEIVLCKEAAACLPLIGTMFAFF